MVRGGMLYRTGIDLATLPADQMLAVAAAAFTETYGEDGDKILAQAIGETMAAELGDPNDPYGVDPALAQSLSGADSSDYQLEAGAL